MAGRSQNQTDCVNLKMNTKFPFKFIPESVKRDQAEEAVQKITNYTNYCLQKNLSNNGTRLCKKPVVTINYPLISGNPRIQLQVLPRPYLATKESSSSTSNEVLRALGQIWKLFVFCLIAAAISGVVIWFLDHKANSGHFPKSFWCGTREGLWWAIVTMTTVGYGDKTPKSFLGRTYASLWMIIGMLLLSSITAQISSTITTDGLRPLDEEFGHNIGLPNGSKKFFEAYSHGATLIEYPTEDDLFRGLEDGIVDKIWLFDCKQNGEKRQFKIVRILDVPPVIGAEVKLAAKNNKTKLKKIFDGCLKKWAEDQEDDGDDLEKAASNILKAEEWETEIPEQRSCLEKYSRGKYRDDKWTPPQMEPIDILLCITAGLLITLFATGALWESCLKLRHARKSLDNNVDIEKATGAQELQSTAATLN
ncbi:hypothetical protein ACROYT_G016595 [Oculina patagonica]